MKVIINFEVVDKKIKLDSKIRDQIINLMSDAHDPISFSRAFNLAKISVSEPYPDYARAFEKIGILDTLISKYMGASELIKNNYWVRIEGINKINKVEMSRLINYVLKNSDEGNNLSDFMDKFGVNNEVNTTTNRTETQPPQ